MTATDLLEAFRKMTLLELSEFIKDFEQTFGVTASAPVQATVPILPVPVDEPEEQTEFTVTLQAIGSNKIQVIKAVRGILKLGLAESKAFTESVPKVLAENVGKADALRIVGDLEAAGATASMR